MGAAVDLYVMGAHLRSMPGTIVDREGPRLWVNLGQGSLEDGEAVCLHAGPEDPWIYGKVLANEERGVLIHVDGSQSPDRREFSRVWGPLHLRVQTVSEGFELAALRWLRTGDGVSTDWLEPPPFMDFSGSGVRFECSPECALQAEDSCLVACRVAGDPTEHRFTATVVRRFASHQVAMRFLGSTPGAIAALVDYSEQIQEQLLELMGEGDQD